MLKLANGILVVLVLVCGALLYALEHRTRGLERQIAVARRAIADTDEDTKMLGAEWSSLTRPERIQALAARNLQLSPAQASQYVTFRELNMRANEIRANAVPAREQDIIGGLLEQLQ
jgi:cell division protein FtsL